MKLTDVPLAPLLFLPPRLRLAGVLVTRSEGNPHTSGQLRGPGSPTLRRRLLRFRGEPCLTPGCPVGLWLRMRP